MSPRRPPLHHDARSGGTCRWCGEAILHESGARDGEANLRRSWHPDCVEAYKLAAWRKAQARFVKKRDGACCAACGAAPKKWLASRRRSIDRQTRGRYVRVRRACALELDHTVPLWSVAHLPPEARRAYYGPDNLKLLCPTCHRAKTTREAAERAARKRAAPTPATPQGFEAYLQAFTRAAGELVAQDRSG
jgi:5-methylcytosine-specific restriction endonuclease McrA